MWGFYPFFIFGRFQQQRENWYLRQLHRDNPLYGITSCPLCSKAKTCTGFVCCARLRLVTIRFLSFNISLRRISCIKTTGGFTSLNPLESQNNTFQENSPQTSNKIRIYILNSEDGGGTLILQDYTTSRPQISVPRSCFYNTCYLLTYFLI